MIRKGFFISLMLLSGCIAPIRPVSTPLPGATPAASQAALVKTETLPLPAKKLPATPTQTAEPGPPIPTGTPHPQQPEPSTPPRPTATPLPRLPSGAAVTLVYVQMASLQTGWAIDTAGRILHTGSGAQAWEDVTPPEGTYWSGWTGEGALRTPGGFFALDGTQAWAVPYITTCYSDGCPTPPETATIWRTIDSGQTWQPSQPFCPNWSGCDVRPDLPGFYQHVLYPVALQFIDAGTDRGAGIMRIEREGDHLGDPFTRDGGQRLCRIRIRVAHSHETAVILTQFFLQGLNHAAVP